MQPDFLLLEHINTRRNLRQHRNRHRVRLSIQCLQHHLRLYVRHFASIYCHDASTKAQD